MPLRSSAITPARANQVASVAAKPTATPAATGRRYGASVPTMLAVIAASTRIDSSPSRKVSTPMSKMAAPFDVCAAVGSGFPEALTACHTRTPTTTSAPSSRAPRMTDRRHRPGRRPPRDVCASAGRLGASRFGAFISGGYVATGCGHD